MYAQNKRSPNLLAIAAIALAALIIFAIAGMGLVGLLVIRASRASAPVSEQIVETQPALVAEESTAQGEAVIEIPPSPPVNGPGLRDPKSVETLGEEGILVELYQRLVPGVVSVQVIRRDQVNFPLFIWRGQQQADI